MIKTEYKYLNEAFTETTKVLDENQSYIPPESCLQYEQTNSNNINLSSIETILIQNAGRFCEFYASDVLYDIQAMHEFTKDVKTNDEQIFIFAMRNSGIDGCSFLTSRIEDTTSRTDFYKLIHDYYRKILAVKITKKDGYIKAEIKDITNNIKRPKIHA